MRSWAEVNVLLTAPTGRASRRMAESTGRSDAITMHSAMGLTNDEESVKPWKKCWMRILSLQMNLPCQT